MAAIRTETSGALMTVISSTVGNCWDTTEAQGNGATDLRIADCDHVADDGLATVDEDTNVHCLVDDLAGHESSL